MKKIDTLQYLHSKVHSMRMLSSYKCSRFEEETNYIIAKHFSDKCSECKFIAEDIEKFGFGEKGMLKKTIKLGSMFNKFFKK